MDENNIEEARVERLWNLLRDDLRRRGADVQTAEDIAQDSWLIALRSPPREPRRLSGYLRMVAIRLLRKNRMRESDRSWREATAARPESSPPAVDGNESSLLRRYVEELPEPYRTALHLRFFENLEVHEIAERLSTKTATVQTHLKRGVARLRERIGLRPEERRRQWSAFVWLAWLRERAASRPRASLRLLSGTAIAASFLLSVWILWRATPTAGRELARPGGISAAPALDEVELSALKPSPVAAARRVNVSAPPAAVRSRLSGTVRTPDGQPLAGAGVHVAYASAAVAEHTTTTDAHGRYEIPREGELLWAMHPEWCESARQYVPSLHELTELDLFVVPTRGRAEVEVVSHAGQPVAGARVLIDSGGSQQVATAVGTLEFRGAFPEAMTDDAGHCWVHFPEQVETELFVLSLEHPGWRGSVPTPADGGSLRIELPAPAAVLGTCSDESGRPLREAQVEVLQLAGLFRREARTDSEGAFRVEGLVPGDFVLRAREAGPRRASARHMGALEPGQLERLALHLDERSSILGRVVDAHGPVAGARVELEMWNVPPAEGTRRTELTDEQGLFAFAGCLLQHAHYIQIFLPGAAEACIGAGPLRPGSGEGRYVVPPPDAAQAPIELAFSGADEPALIELRRDYQARSAILAREHGSGPFRSLPLPAGDYGVLAWHPALGIWKERNIRHDPLAPLVHRFSWPMAAMLAVELELPVGVARDEVEVALLVPAFHRNSLGLFATGNSRRVLGWNEPERAFVGCVAPGTYPLQVRGRGFSETHQKIELAAGAVHRLSLTPCEGIETTVFFESWATPAAPKPGLSWGMRPYESVQLEALTPGGSTRLELLGKALRRVEGGFEFTVWLPRTTTELRARTATTVLEPYPLREGSCVLEPGALETAVGRPRVRIPLSIVPAERER